jgi:type VI secretion system peptidoglycan-associated protein
MVRDAPDCIITVTAFSTDFFVCYASLDGGEAARALVADLEAHDVKCWIAPRNIPLGVTWPQAIVAGIEASRAMLLVVTKASNESDDVEKEVGLAVHLRKIIFPLRVVDVQLSGTLLYQLQIRQWRDLFVDRESAINEIVAQIKSIRDSAANRSQKSNSLNRTNTDQSRASDKETIPDNLPINPPGASDVTFASKADPQEAQNLLSEPVEPVEPVESAHDRTIAGTVSQHWGAVWAAAAFAGLILLGSYLYLRDALSGQAEALAIKMAAVHPATELTIARETAVPPPPDPRPGISAQLQRIRAELAKEIMAGKVEADENEARIFISIGDDLLFPSSGAKVSDSFAPIAAKISTALDREPGAISVDGYTDSDPIRTVAFPSNFELSQARAKSVAAMLKPGLSEPDRLTVSGRGADNPVAPNDTEENKSKNRRIEVSIPRADL